jgi:hypothetical protein
MVSRSGEVIFLAGGFSDSTSSVADAEVYSPDGGCQLKVNSYLWAVSCCLCGDCEAARWQQKYIYVYIYGIAQTYIESVPKPRGHFFIKEARYKLCAYTTGARHLFFPYSHMAVKAALWWRVLVV